jgi:glycosyltransferase involved in cell wall biosynthesis
LIRAYNEVRDQINDKLVIVGATGWKNTEILSEIDSSNIIFLEYVNDEDLNILYNMCHYFAYVSFYEGFGLPPLEAMSLGKEVLISNTSSMTEVGGKFANYINPNSIRSIADMIVRMSKQVDNSLINMKLIEYSKQFSYKHSALKTIKAYNDLSI